MGAEGGAAGRCGRARSRAVVESCRLSKGVAFLLRELGPGRLEPAAGAAPAPGRFAISFCLEGRCRLCGVSWRAEVLEGEAVVVRGKMPVVCVGAAGYRDVTLVVDPTALDEEAMEVARVIGLDVGELLDLRTLGSDPLVCRVDEHLAWLLRDVASRIGLHGDHAMLRLRATEVLVAVERSWRVWPKGALGPAFLSRVDLARGLETCPCPSEIPNPPPDEAPAHAALARRARRIMAAHLSEPLDIRALARALGVSPTVLKESFREEFGAPVGTWYRSYRMGFAVHLLERGDLSIAEIARAVGYVSPSKFARAFADEKGASPSEWRRLRHLNPSGGRTAS